MKRWTGSFGMESRAPEIARNSFLGRLTALRLSPLETLFCLRRADGRSTETQRLESTS